MKRMQSREDAKSATTFLCFSDEENNEDIAENTLNKNFEDSFISGQSAVPVSYRLNPLTEETNYFESDEEISQNILEKTIRKNSETIQNNTLQNNTTSTEYMSLCIGKENIKIITEKDDNLSVNDSTCSNVIINESRRDTNYNFRRFLEQDSFENILSTLINKATQSEEITTKEQAVEYLSQTFHTSPKKFANELVTIIEESVINNSYNFDFDSSKLNENSDNFIINESIPSFINATLRNMEMSELNIKTPKTINSPSKRALSTPPSIFNRRIKKVYRKTPLSVFKQSISSENDTLKDDSCFEFELLEAHLNMCFPEKNQDKKPIPETTISDIKQIRTIIKQQIESLYDDNEVSLSEIRKKREECFDSAMTEMQINSKQSQEDIHNNCNNEKFWKTLKSCKQYFSCLEEHKTLLSQSQTNDLKFNNILKINCNKDIKTPSRLIPEIVVSSYKSPKRKETYSKPTYLTSPKQKLGRQFHSAKINSRSENIILRNSSKSVTMNSKYRGVVSPVGMYIRGVNPVPKKHLKNVKKKIEFSPEEGSKEKVYQICERL